MTINMDQLNDSCHPQASNFWLRGYAARLLGEPMSNACIYKGQPKVDWEAGHKAADKDTL